MTTINIQITGMTCEQCAKDIQDSLNSLKNVCATVSYKDAMAKIKTQGLINNDLLLKAIESNGYSANIVKDHPGSNTNNTATRMHIVIVGTGSGAFAAAIQSIEQGARVTMIENADVIGGTCVNIGCIPSKILIQGAHVIHQQGHHDFSGIQLNTPVINRKAMLAQQQTWVKNLRYAKYESIIESNPDIDLIRGSAHFKDSKTLIIDKQNGSALKITADRFLLAVGARPLIPLIDGLANTPFWTSTDALVAEIIPKHLVVLGGSVVALELAQAFCHLGSKVTVIARSTLLSKEDIDLGQGLKTVFEREGIIVELQTVPDLISYNDHQFVIRTRKGDIKCDQLLVATGRQSNADTLSLENAGVTTNNANKIIIDDRMQTNVKHIFAVGDCTSQPQFVYVAAAAGSRAARNMAGNDIAIDLSVMPAVVFTHPQVATVGLSQQQAQQQGLDVDSRILNLEHVPRAIANRDTRGFIKLVAEKNSGRIVGCQILADGGGEIIQTAALAIRNNMTVDTLANQLFPYLTMVEGLKLTAQTFSKDITQLSCCAG